MRGLRSRVVIAVVGVLAVRVAEADDSGPANLRVRLTAPAIKGKPLIGRLLAADDAVLRIETRTDGDKDSTIEVPRSAVTRFEVSRAHSRKGKGALIGALVGVAASVGVGLVAGDDCSNPPPGDDLVSRLDRNLCFDKGETGLMTAILAVPAGALIGALVAPGERWEAVDGARLRVGLVPGRGHGIQVRLALSF